MPVSVRPVVVMKFGGTSMADRDCVRRVAGIVAQKRSAGHRVVAVVSARARQTDGFIEEARALAPSPNPREIDMLLSSGERISAALLAIALRGIGCPALALSGSQAGIITDDNHTNARIIEIRPVRVLEALMQEIVPVVGGFQGVSFRKEITTLGRGGSDVTAVALASALEAETCEIYSDVDGVYSADPRVVRSAVRLDEISYSEMQEMGEAGARVLHPGSVEFARIKDTIIHAKCTMEPDGGGTVIRDLEGRLAPRVVGVACDEKLVVLQVDEGEPEGMRRLCGISGFLEREGLKVKQVHFQPGPEGELSGSILIPERENYQIESALGRLDAGPGIRVLRGLATVSLIGTGITDRQAYLRDALGLLRGAGISLSGLEASSFRIVFLIPRGRIHEAARIFHSHFIESQSV